MTSWSVKWGGSGPHGFPEGKEYNVALTASEHLEDVCGGAKMTSWSVKWGGSGPHGFLWRLSGVTSTQ